MLSLYGPSLLALQPYVSGVCLQISVQCASIPRWVTLQSALELHLVLQQYHFFLL